MDLNSKGYGPKNWPSDVSQIEKKKLSLTPIEPDLFWRDSLEMLPNIQLLQILLSNHKEMHNPTKCAAITCVLLKTESISNPVIATSELVAIAIPCV